jgi:hypothetical protein
MKALTLTFLAIALATAAAAAPIDNRDGCTTKSLHGVWDCR